MLSRRPLTTEDVLSFKSVEDAQISPDGTRVAFTVGDSFKLDSKWPRSTIWTVSRAGGPAIQLTTGPRTDSLPRWSPDGRHVAFLSDRLQEGQRQVFLLPAGGGEAIALTEIKGEIPSPRGLSALQWSPDGSALGFLMEDPETDEERQRREDKNDAITFEQNLKYVRLWTVEVATGEVCCASPTAGVQIWEFAWHPSGSEIAAVASDLPTESAWYGNRLVRFDLGGDVETLWQSECQAALPLWSPSGEQLAFISSTWSDRACVAGDAWLLEPGGEARNLTEGMVAGIGWLAWSPDGCELQTIGHERGGTGIYRIRVADGERSSLWWQQAAVSIANWPRFSHAENGDLAVVLEDAENPLDVWIGRPADSALEWTQLTNLHPQSADIEIGETDVHEWMGADGEEMQGLLIKPVGYEVGKRYPLVMSVHGGPSGVSGSRYYAASGWAQLMANEGYAVFMPNYRGSVGWGRKFSESNLGDMGGKDFEDMMLGIDSLIGAGIADADRLALSGWSYGGFIAAWAVSQTDRFRTVVMGAGISHWLSFHGKSCLPAWDQLYYQASPYEAEGRYTRFSPLSYYDNLQTPTLILHGEVDEDVPVEQSYLFYRAMKDKGIPVELIVYPREPHGVIERAHVRDMAERVTNWLRQYLKEDDHSA